MFCVFQDFAIKTVKSTHEFWKALISKKTSAGEINWWITHTQYVISTISDIFFHNIQYVIILHRVQFDRTMTAEHG